MQRMMSLRWCATLVATCLASIGPGTRMRDTQAATAVHTRCELGPALGLRSAEPPPVLTERNRWA